jgi:hypothetical protein
MIESYVKNGMALLNSKGPANWREKVYLERLNMSNGLCCVLGQLYGTYLGGLEVLFGPEPKTFEGHTLIAKQHGFTVTFDRIASMETQFAWLEEEWRRQLAKEAP